MSRALLLFFTVAAVLALGGSVPASIARAETVITVNTTADELNSDGDCSLREAFQAANLDAAADACPAGNGRDLVSLPAGVFTLTGEASANGGLLLTQSAAVTGTGHNQTVIDGGSRLRVLTVRNGSASGSMTVNMSGLTMRNGNSSSYGGAVLVEGGAGLTLHATEVTGNEAFSGGGGVRNDGFMQVFDSTISANDGGPRGGGIVISSTGYLELRNSLVSGNTATSGGGILNNGRLESINSTISGNTADRGAGGISNSATTSDYRTGQVSLIGSTVTGNMANARRDLGNVDAVGGGIRTDASGTAQVFLWNTILAENTDNRDGLSSAAPDCHGALISERNNVVGNNGNCTITDPFWGNSLPFDQVGTPSNPINPLLEPLADNGGPTRTHALRPGSPAIDKGSAATPGSDIFACEPNDQRGASRPYDGDGDGTAVCDVGAYEYGADIIAPTAQSPTQSLVANSALGASTVPVKISWSATDNPGGSGVAGYELQRSVGGSSYTTVNLPSPATTTVTQSLDPGKTYRFRVRAKDDAGNVGEWSEGPQFEVKAFQENDTAVAYPSGTWSRVQLSGAYGGYVKYTGALGAKARLSFTGRNVAWVAPKANNRGKAEVWLDGTKVATVDLYSSSSLSGRVVFQRAVDPSRSHVLEVRVLGTKNASSTGKRVDVDAFVVLR